MIESSLFPGATFLCRMRRCFVCQSCGLRDIIPARNAINTHLPVNSSGMQMSRVQYSWTPDAVRTVADVLWIVSSTDDRT